jgi:two-component system KDP operon response regulator KdpE
MASSDEAGADRPSILVVGADRRLRALVRLALPPERYAVTEVEGIPAALEAVFRRRPDLVLVTSDPGGTQGSEECREIQSAEDVPVIVLSPSLDAAGVVRSLTCADDYIALPVSPQEVEARVRAVLRRAQPRPPAGPVYDDGVLRVNLQERTVTLGGGPVHLTPTEYRLLAVLVSHPGRVLPHDELLRRVWGSAYAGDSHLLRLHMANLRAKLEGRGGRRYLRTYRGLGYAFVPRDEPAGTGADG